MWAECDCYAPAAPEPEPEQIEEPMPVPPVAPQNPFARWLMVGNAAVLHASTQPRQPRISASAPYVAILRPPGHQT